MRKIKHEQNTIKYKNTPNKIKLFRLLLLSVGGFLFILSTKIIWQVIMIDPWVIFIIKVNHLTGNCQWPFVYLFLKTLSTSKTSDSIFASLLWFCLFWLFAVSFSFCSALFCTDPCGTSESAKIAGSTASMFSGGVMSKSSNLIVPYFNLFICTLLLWVFHLILF